MIEIILGIGALTSIFLARQSKVKREFLDEHEDNIRANSQRIVDAWRASEPKEKKLFIQRTFKPPVFLAPTIKLEESFNRDPRPWYKRWFS